MKSKFARVAAMAGLAAGLTFTPTLALAETAATVETVTTSALVCLITIDTPWGEFCLVAIPE
jgi:hypothetical protein